MAAGDSNYQGGSEVVLTNFYNTLRQDQYRREQQDALQQQAKNKASIQTAKDLEDVTSKLSSKGLRNQAEIGIYTKMYEDVKGYKALANSAETPSERAKYTVLTRDAAKKAMDFVDGAEEFKKGEIGIANKFQANPFSFGEDQKKLLKTNLEKPYTELGTRFDPTPYSTRLSVGEVGKRVDNQIKGIIDAQGTLLARTKGLTVGNNVGNLLYQDVIVAPQEAAKGMLKLLNTDLAVREHYERIYPNAKPEEIATNIVNDRIDKLGNISKRDATGSFVQNDKPKEVSNTELKQQAALGLRTSNVTNIVDKKNQSTLEEFKASLPAGATVQWVLKDGLNSQKIKAEGRNARPDEIKGIHIIVPAGVDKGFTPFPKIDDTIDFSKGDPKKAVNNYYNKFVGKNIENEDLGASGVKGNTSKPKPTTTKTKPKKGILD